MAKYIPTRRASAVAVDLAAPRCGPFFVLGIILISTGLLGVGWAVVDESGRKIVESIGASLAVFVASGAALIAYDGAMVRLRREHGLEQQRVQREQIALLMKLDMACNEFEIQTGKGTVYLAFGGEVPVDLLRVIEPEEFKEAWDNLHLIQPEARNELRIIRNAIKDDRHLLADIIPGSIIRSAGNASGTALLKRLQRNHHNAREATFVLQQILKPEIDRWIVPLATHLRNPIIHGDE